MKSISVSVVIPAYNAAGTIISAIKSVREQTCYERCITEIIVVDDGSTDGTASIVSDYAGQVADDRVKLVTIKNSGPSAARNKGISLAVSRWVAFLDSDDTWMPRKTERQLQVLSLDSDAVFIATASDRVEGGYGPAVDLNVYRLNIVSYLTKSRITTTTVIIKRSAFKEVGMFDPLMRYAEDENLFMRVIANYNSYYIDEPLVRMFNKRMFGEGGLSSNIGMMHKGRIYNIKMCQKNRYITKMEFCRLVIIEHVKYLRRVILTNTLKRK